MSEPIRPADEDDEPALTAAGHVERRRDGFVTRAEFRGWRNRAAALFLALAAISCFAAYLGWHAGRESTNGLRRNSTAAQLQTCLAGAELRIAVAGGFDQLRRLAVQRATPKQLERFIRATQPALDVLLSQAAGREFHAPLPPGEVNAAVRASVRDLAAIRCAARAAAAASTS